LLEGLIERSILAGRPDAHRAEWEAELYGNPCPAAMAYLWRIFNRLRRRVGGNGFGANPISWPDLDAFVRYSRINLAPWEIEVIEDLDDLFLIAMAPKPSSQPPKGES